MTDYRTVVRQLMVIAIALLVGSCDDSDLPYAGLSRVDAEAFLVINDSLGWYAMIRMPGIQQHFCVGVYDGRLATARNDSQGLAQALQANQPASLKADFRPVSECTRNGTGDIMLPSGERAMELFAVINRQEDKYEGNWLGGHGPRGPAGPFAYGSFFDVSMSWGKLQIQELGSWNTGPNGEL